MFKKVCIAIMLSIAMFLTSAADAAGMKARTKDGYYKGNYVYWVQLRNDNGYRVYCKLRATNGAAYKFYLNAYDTSRWFRINDPMAEYRYVCKDYRW